MTVRRVIILLLLVLMVIFVGCGEDEPEISSVEDLKDTDAKNIIWEKDGAQMVLIPEVVLREKDTYDKFGDLVLGKVVKVSDSIYMDTTEVTVGQFKKFLKSSDYEPEEPIDWEELYEYSPTDKHPMIYVSWFDAQAYCEWVGKRLPREAEWEYAARGGLNGKRYPWGDDEGVAREYANFAGTGGKDKWDYTTAPVGSFRPNGYGLHDMAGNVWEWCGDWYTKDKKSRVVRGNSWKGKSSNLRVAFRSSDAPTFAYFSFGFRCVSGSK